MIEMYQAFNENRIQPTQELTSEHHGNTSMEQFSTTFAKAYKK